MDWQLMAMFGAVLFITLLPLVVVLSSAPPLIDDAATTISRARVWPWLAYHHHSSPLWRARKRTHRMNIFQRAHAGLSLSPEERAFLKLVQGFVITGLVAALGTLATVVSNGATLHDAVIATIVAFAVGVILAAAKYFSANGQAPLAQMLTGVATTIEHQFEPTPLKRPGGSGAPESDPPGGAA